ncbi:MULTISPECIES: hypothetical protein [Arsenicicoccus]|uniref:Uncharacterized protein n=1 Tax=Arsenicicoccus bolidensis TaxID=229480 RepID=A0ABS9PZR7_9MICO|nr:MULTISPECIES: hypothetical protein [Arsenicicoccus]MCG7321128.1 hypothetical protein [Arsenicicoccus bolidensis]
MDRRALTPLVVGLLCFAVALMIRSGGLVRGLLMFVAAGFMVYAVSVMTRDRR